MHSSADYRPVLTRNTPPGEANYCRQPRCRVNGGTDSQQLDRIAFALAGPNVDFRKEFPQVIGERKQGKSLAREVATENQADLVGLCFQAGVKTGFTRHEAIAAALDRGRQQLPTAAAGHGDAAASLISTTNEADAIVG